MFSLDVVKARAVSHIPNFVMIGRKRFKGKITCSHLLCHDKPPAFMAKKSEKTRKKQKEKIGKIQALWGLFQASIIG